MTDSDPVPLLLHFGTFAMTTALRISSSRKLLALAVGLGLLPAAMPGAALAGGGTTAKTPKCDPAVQVCESGRKNG